jgi:hypothetical protein
MHQNRNAKQRKLFILPSLLKFNHRLLQSKLRLCFLLPSRLKKVEKTSIHFFKLISDSSFDKENVLKNLGDFGAQFGTIEFPPALKPIPAKSTLFDIAGDKG